MLRHSPAAHCPSYHNTIFFIAIQIFPQSAFLPIQNIVLQYNFMQSSLLQYKTYNTILAYTSLSHNTKYCIAIQTALKSLSLCNTTHSLAIQNISSQYHLGSSPKRFCIKYFFFFIYFQQLEKSLKSIFFFHFLEHSNKFTRIYFLHFIFHFPEYTYKF